MVKAKSPPKAKSLPELVELFKGDISEGSDTTCLATIEVEGNGNGTPRREVVVLVPVASNLRYGAYVELDLSAYVQHGSGILVPRLDAGQMRDVLFENYHGPSKVYLGRTP